MKSNERIANSDLHFALVGKRLDYSFSKKYFTQKFENENINATYENIEVADLQSLKKIISEKNISGFNVTVPYKKSILDLVDHQTEIVEEVGAANCIEINQKGDWIAYNTDVIGFEKSLTQLLSQWQTKPIKVSNALVFGSGGASEAVQFVLKKLGIDFQLVSRTRKENSIQYSDLNEGIIGENELLINTTPLGTYPNIEAHIDIPFEFLNKNHFCFDLVYNPAKTKFLRLAEEQGASIKNGLEMLKIQAEESWKIWNNN